MQTRKLCLHRQFIHDGQQLKATDVAGRPSNKAETQINGTKQIRFFKWPQSDR